MRKYTSPLISIVVIALGSLITVLALGWRPELGLDLQGGASVILEPREEATADQLDVASQIIRDRVDSLGVAEPEIRIQGDTIVVELPGVKDQADALELVGKTGELRFRPVLSQFPGAATAPSTTTTVPGATTTTVAGATTTVAGASGEVTATVADGATTTVAPTTTVAAADTTAGGPGEARPRLRTATTEPASTEAPTTTVAAGDTTVPGDTTAPGDTVAPPATDPLTTATAPADQFVPEVDEAGLIAVTPREEDTPEATVVLPEYDGDKEMARYLLGPTAFNGSIVSSARATFPTNEWIVELEVKGGAAGIDLWNALAAQCYEGTATCPASGGGLTGQIAVVLDGRVISAPAVQPDNKAQGVGFQPFQADQISISGGFDEDAARELVKFLNYGALPVDLEPQAVQTVSATLGKDSLRAGIVAGAIGIGLVVVLMLLYYRSLGIVVLLGLCVSGALMYSIIALLGEQQGLALTLAGATGVIVSVGVTVDSYVVYFERLKDDVRAGRSLRASAERGFKQAYRTIVAADIVSLIGAFLLWYLTVGSVRGFAFFLGLSAIIDLIVAYFFTRPLVAILSRTKRFSGSSVLGVVTGEAKAATQGGVA